MLDLIIVILVVAGVALWLGRRWWRTARGRGAGCGCGCGCGEGGCPSGGGSAPDLPACRGLDGAPGSKEKRL